MTKSNMQALLTQEGVHDIQASPKHKPLEERKPYRISQTKQITLWTDKNTVQHPKPQNHLTDVPLQHSQITMASPSLTHSTSVFPL